MNKKELVDQVAMATGISKKKADAVIKATFDAITEALVAGDNVQLTGFGTFNVVERAARTAFNPAAKEKIEVPASKVPRFKAGKALKDAVK